MKSKNMKIWKRNVALIALITILANCSDDSVDLPPVFQVVEVRNMEDGELQSTLEYSYEGNQLKSVSQEWVGGHSDPRETRYHYDEQSLLIRKESERFWSSTESVIATTLYNYDALGRISSTSQTDTNDPSDVTRYNYEYNEQNQCIRRVGQFDEKTQIRLYRWNDLNIEWDSIYIENGAFVGLSRVYGDAVNPSYHFLSNSIPGFPTSKNLELSVTAHRDNSGYTFVNEIEMNEHNYPIKVEKTFASGGKYTLEYEYRQLE